MTEVEVQVDPSRFEAIRRGVATIPLPEGTPVDALVRVVERAEGRPTSRWVVFNQRHQCFPEGEEPSVIPVWPPVASSIPAGTEGGEGP